MPTELSKFEARHLTNVLLDYMKNPDHLESTIDIVTQIETTTLEIFEKLVKHATEPDIETSNGELVDILGLHYDELANFTDEDFRKLVEIRRRRMKILKIQANPIILEAMQWESNEPQLREWVGDQNNLRFKNEGLEVWNRDTQTWEHCPIFHYVIKGTKGELSVVSPDLMATNYSIVE